MPQLTRLPCQSTQKEQCPARQCMVITFSSVIFLSSHLFSSSEFSRNRSSPFWNLPRYRTRTIPAAGAILKPEDRGEEQLTLL